MKKQKTLDYKPVEKVINRLTANRPPKLPVLHRLIRDMSSDTYHSTVGTWSSSQLKDINEDEEHFIKKHVKKEIAREDNEAFGTGNHFHTTMLEPHKLASEFVVFSGKARYGKNWDIFKKKHSGKCIVTQKQVEVSNEMAKAVKASPVSMKYLKGEPEISLFTKLVVSGGHIYAPQFKKKLLREGWVPYSKEIGKGFELIVKVRADCLGSDFISDLKSTSGKATSHHSVRLSISKYNYDLSAALYLDMFSLMKESVQDFIWIFASKTNPCAAAYRATEDNILVGRAKWSWAVKRLADLHAANWEIVDYLREIEPLPHEREWLREKDTDYL